MPTTMFSYKKDSYSLSKDEKEVLLMFLNFFKYEISDGNGSYLAMLDLDKIDFVWSPVMLLNDNGVFGSWTFMYKDKVFIRPSENSIELVEKLKTMKLSGEDKEYAEDIIESKSRQFIQFKELNLNQELLKFSMYLCECDGVILSTIFHELYHKWQYNSSKLLYIINFFVFLFIGYSFSTKSRFSIEGDVRIYVDNDDLHGKLSKFYNTFYSYLYIKNLLKTEDNESKREKLLNQLNEMEKTENRYFTFCEKLLSRLQK